MIEIYTVLVIRAPPPPHGGHVFHLNNFESFAPKDDSCQVWLKSDQGCVFKKKMKVTFYINPLSTRPPVQ